MSEGTVDVNCPAGFNGTAAVECVGDDLRWIEADAEIHVADELLASGDRELVTRRYSIGAPCPFLAGTHHARLTTVEV